MTIRARLEKVEILRNFDPCIYRVRNELPASWGAEVTEIALKYFFRGGADDELVGSGRINVATGEEHELENTTDACVKGVAGIIEVSIDGDPVYEGETSDAAEDGKCLTELEYVLTAEEGVDEKSPKRRSQRIGLRRVER